MKKSINEKNVLLLKEAAEYTGISYLALRNMVAAGELPVKQIGRLFYISRSKLNEIFDIAE